MQFIVSPNTRIPDSIQQKLAVDDKQRDKGMVFSADPKILKGEIRGRVVIDANR